MENEVFDLTHLILILGFFLLACSFYSYYDGLISSTLLLQVFVVRYSKINK